MVLADGERRGKQIDSGSTKFEFLFKDPYLRYADPMPDNLPYLPI